MHYRATLAAYRCTQNASVRLKVAALTISIPRNLKIVSNQMYLQFILHCWATKSVEKPTFTNQLLFNTK